MRRVVLMLALVFAGELVFGLVFNVPRFFRPTMLEVFGITNTELGDMFAVYGVIAMLAYFPGGAIADRYPARALIAVSLVATSVGGIYMATIPGVMGMQILYGYWGLTSIFLFWGALIRATRDWGGRQSQGVAFGILDGGRGLVAAFVAMIGVYILAFYLPDNARLATVEERETGFRLVVLFYTLLTFMSGVFSWYAIPEEERMDKAKCSPLKGMGAVLRRPIIWAQAGVIVCAYCGYKGLDNFSLYAVQILGMDEVDGARLATYGAWMRPIAAVLAGLTADRYQAARSIGVLFAILGVSCFAWSSTAPSGSGMTIIYLNFFTTFGAVYALRGIYFALLEENRTPKFLTGAAVGLVSLIGYTPDVFFGPITGRILDANPGLVGHQNYFLFLASVAALGILMVIWMLWLRRYRGKVL
ncbi:MAG: MFS transporter [Woeseiaceae bacterium]|nr:MFS transporter [Woeseiaceae bacterium]